MTGLETALLTSVITALTGGVPAWLTFRAARHDRVTHSRVVPQSPPVVSVDNEEMQQLVGVLLRRNAVLTRAVTDLGGTVPPWDDGLE